MKRTTLKLTAAMLLAATILNGCQSASEKKEDAQEKVIDAQKDLNQAQQDANAEAKKAASIEDWKTFRTETELKIKENELRIAELKLKMKQPGTTFDAVRAKKIETLEQKNKELRARIEVYEKDQGDWESFKREFNHDMDEIGSALKDLTVDNKK